jgi:hypothetical protein
VSLRIPSSSRSPDHDPHRTIYYLGYPLGRFAGLKHRQLARHVGVIITTNELGGQRCCSVLSIGDAECNPKRVKRSCRNLKSNQSTRPSDHEQQRSTRQVLCSQSKSMLPGRHVHPTRRLDMVRIQEKSARRQIPARVKTPSPAKKICRHHYRQKNKPHKVQIPRLAVTSSRLPRSPKPN